MYRLVTTTGTILGVTEEVRYIKKHPTSGCYIDATEEDAIGVAYNSTPYNLFGHNEIEDADTVIVAHVDGGNEIGGLKEKDAEQSDHLAEVDEIAIDLYEQNLALEAISAGQDEAIIEIYEMMGGIV